MRNHASITADISSIRPRIRMEGKGGAGRGGAGPGGDDPPRKGFTPPSEESVAWGEGIISLGYL